MPRIPSRRAVLAGSAASVASVAAATAAPEMHTTQPNFALTELGQEFVKRLQTHAPWAWLDAYTPDAEWSPEYDAARCAEIDRNCAEKWSLLMEAVRAVIAAAERDGALAHLGDLAAVVRNRDDKSHSQDDEDSQTIRLLTDALLSLGAVKPEMVDDGAVFEAAGRAHRAECGHCSACRSA